MSEQDRKDGAAQVGANDDETPVASRRGFLKAGAALGAGALMAAPYIGNAQTARGVKWKMQSAWQPGTVGYRTFETWCRSVKELTSGELEIEPFAAGAVAGTFEMADAVRTGVLDGMNWFTVYWPGKMPAGVFMSAYPMALSLPHHWDMMLDSFGGRQIVDELYDRQGLVFLGHVQHDLNLIHSKVPLRSFDDFKGKRIRFPGGIVAETFAEVGVRTTLLPGGDVYPALERGTIDAADFVGPAVNYDLGFHQVTKYIIMGPPSTPCLHQPVDLMDISVNKRSWARLSKKTQELMYKLVRAYSAEHFAAIQKANHEAWPKYKEAGVEVIHLSEEDAQRFRKAAIPLWFKWANKDKDAARLFKIHLEVMQDPSVAVITPDDIKGHKLNF
ncbi:MAG: TRAP transporter substrate-binding protein DctP [Ectothiorhodospiraceae bacterium]|jgi:TRAP-type mannitol/chloroaromatic compound transport system substrate-binding protein|nr:TRAP transporter substrate-binding protein DctP [Ectothiorhodospiraceae bacterium]